MIKRVLVPNRLRRVPPQFSWIDQQLVRGGFLQRCDASAAALYLLLVTVADAQGLSYYGDTAICRHLHLMPEQLTSAREQLIHAELIAFQAPLYQVLALPAAAMPSPVPIDRREASVRLQQLREQLRSRRGRL